MLTQLVNFLGRRVQTKTLAPVKKAPTYENPFANPFVTSFGAKNNPFYGKNKPVAGGYFAGYYNGKPNIVGTRLFVEA